MDKRRNNYVFDKNIDMDKRRNNHVFDIYIYNIYHMDKRRNDYVFVKNIDMDKRLTITYLIYVSHMDKTPQWLRIWYM